MYDVADTKILYALGSRKHFQSKNTSTGISLAISPEIFEEVSTGMPQVMPP